MEINKLISNNVEFEPKEHKYFLNGQEIPSVTSIIRTGFPMTSVDEKAMEYARDRGTLIHSWLENHFNPTDEYEKTFNEMENKYDLYELNGWLKMAKRGLQELVGVYPEPQNIVSEVPLAHTKLYYAGTFDMLFQYGEKIVLVDFKTSRNHKSIPNNYWDKKTKVEVQLAAYSMILEDVFDVKPTNFEVLTIGTRGAELIEIKPNFKLFDTLFEQWKAINGK